MNKKIIFGAAFLGVTLSTLVGCKKRTNADVYENGRLVLNLKNVYFDAWDGSDVYTEQIQRKFGVKIKPSSYGYNTWTEDFNGQLNGNNLPDVFHYDLESFNVGNTYNEWVRGKIIKPLPDNMSKWPKVKALVDNSSNINALKIGGKVYGIPLAYDPFDPSKNFSSFTYVYRRDWVKKIDEKKAADALLKQEAYVPLYQENDIYTWDQFLAVIRAFKAEKGNHAGIADVPWGFPSITNFYKDSPHCYTYNSSGKVVNAFTSDKYTAGLDQTRNLIRENLYFDQATNSSAANEGTAHDEYKASHVGIFYENLSLSNYITLRKDYRSLHPQDSEEAINDATAIMKVKGPDGKYHLEGSENWFSMTLFNYDISDNKMSKILDIMEYLLSDEGTRLAIYGIEGNDYSIDENGDVELSDSTWIKQSSNGEYAPIVNGAKYLREMVTLNNDTSGFDPFVDQKSYQIIKSWQDEMKTAKAQGNLVIFEEPSEIKWISTPKKDVNTSALIKEGNDNAMVFCYGNETIDQYKAKFNVKKWTDTIAEINSALGK